MVISFTNNFIFLRVPKNASSSLAEYFVRNQCTRGIDKWTGVNDCGIRDHQIPKTTLAKFAHQYRSIHLTLNEILCEDIITREQARDMKKIVVIRNPLHRQLSLYFFLSRNKRQDATVEGFRKVFAEGKHESDSNNVYTQAQYVKLGNDIAPNVEFWKYESINKKIPNLEKRKSGFRPQRDMDDIVNEYYDDATRKAVLDYYAEDMNIYKSL